MADVDMDTFDAFMERKSKVYFLCKVDDTLVEDGHLKYACTCPEYLHYALCKHVLSIDMLEDEEGTRALFKPEWRATKIGVRSKPGRPKKISAALVKDK